MTITQDELETLRGQGEDDTKILSQYRRFAPEHDGDIGTLLDRGEKPKAILDQLVKYHAKGGGGETPADPMENKGWAEKLQGAVQFGLANLAEGPARTAARTGNEGASKFFQDKADAIAPRGYEPASKHFDALSPSTYGYAGRALLENAPGMGADIAAGATGAGAGSFLGPVGSAVGGALGFGGSYLLRNYGPNLDARMQNQVPAGVDPKTAQPSTTDQVMAGGTTLAEAALNKLGLGGLGGKAVGALGSTVKGAGMDAVKQIPGKIIGAGAREATTGAIGDVANQVGRTAGTDAGLSVDPHEVANVAGLSGATGATIRASRGITDVVQAGKLRDLNPESAARVADEIKQTGVNVDPVINSAGKSYDAFTTARNAKDAELSHWTKQTNATRKGDDDLTIQTNQALKNLRDGKVLSHEEIDAIGKAHGDTQEGAAFHQALQDRNTYNQIAHKGRMESNGDGTGFLAGGLSSSPLAETYLNPLSLTRRVQAYLPGVAGLGMGAQAGMAGAAMAKLAAIPAAAYGGLRALDGITGNRNPVKQVVNRFGGMDRGADPAALPSSRQEALDTKQATQEQTLQGRRDQEANKVVQSLAQQALRNQVGMGKAQAKDASAQEKAQAQAEALRAKQEDAGWKAKDQLSAEEARKQAEMDKAWSKKDTPLPPQADPEALWAQQEGKPQPTEWNDQEALAAIQRELASRDKASQAILKLQGRPEKPVESPKAPKGTNGSQKPETAAEGPSEAPVETYTVTHKGQTVERPLSEVHTSLPGSKAKILKSMRTRQSLADDLMQVAGSNHANKVETFLTHLNHTARSGDDAYGHFEDMLQHLPEKSWAKAFEIWNDHEPKILGTYGE